MSRFDADSLGDRMKRYEAVPQVRLVPKVPMILRLDGRAFHTLTRGLRKPHDEVLWSCMVAAARAVCEDVMGARLAYLQSDEISVLAVDYQTPTTQGWFDHQVQKVVSVAASVATAAFNAAWSSVHRGSASFDCRAWSLPREEVCNYFIWRQQDAVRNSILGLAQAHFSHAELHGAGSAVMQDMLHRVGVNWNDLPTAQRRGVCLVPQRVVDVGLDGPVTRRRWVVDAEIPVFTSDREYADRWVRPDPYDPPPSSA